MVVPNRSSNRMFRTKRLVWNEMKVNDFCPLQLIGVMSTNLPLKNSGTTIVTSIMFLILCLPRILNKIFIIGIPVPSWKSLFYNFLRSSSFLHHLYVNIVNYEEPHINWTRSKWNPLTFIFSQLINSNDRQAGWYIFIDNTIDIWLG